MCWKKSSKGCAGSQSESAPEALETPLSRIAFPLRSENSDFVGATGRSPADGNRKSGTGELPLAPTTIIFMRHWVRLRRYVG
jgi:hypothetical protein